MGGDGPLGALSRLLRHFWNRRNERQTGRLVQFLAVRMIWSCTSDGFW